MTTATVDITDIKKISRDEKYISKLNTAIGIDDHDVEQSKTDDNYYYTSGTFNFMLDRGFKPETLENTTLTAIPFLPVWHKGIVSIHGVIMPVIDILSFVQSQNITATERNTHKTYLLKLEHEDYNPIVFSLDSIPRLINIDNFNNIKTTDESPTWIQKYLENDSMKLAFVDHVELFDQLIKKQ